MLTDPVGSVLRGSWWVFVVLHDETGFKTGCTYFINVHEVPSHALMDGETPLPPQNLYADGEVCVCLAVTLLKNCPCSCICQLFGIAR